ncbi:MAG: hypothetical protein KAW56_11815 [Candidatus Marinimicrobia bacterium]|nr:hypothetical protein [Candidatus Neomarinimicrobiota bacterium]
MQKTNKERLAAIETSITHIDKNIDKIANNNVNQWKQINKNAQGISAMKAISGVISGLISLVIAGVITYFGVKHQ